MEKAFVSVFRPDPVYTTHPVQFNGVDPLLSVIWVLRSEIPHTVVYTDVHSALVKLVRLWKINPNNVEKWLIIAIKMKMELKLGKYFMQTIWTFWVKRRAIMSLLMVGMQPPVNLSSLTGQLSVFDITAANVVILWFSLLQTDLLNSSHRHQGQIGGTTCYI